MAPYQHKLTVRFRDCDAFGHVNNAVYLTFLEEARSHWLFSLTQGASLADIPFIVASIQIDYRSPAYFQEELDISVRVDDMRSRSFALASEITCGDRLVANARVVLVAYDHANRKAVPVPEELKLRLLASVQGDPGLAGSGLPNTGTTP